MRTTALFRRTVRTNQEQSISSSVQIDSRLPGGGLALGALHKVAGGGNAAIDGAAAALFAAGIAACTKGKVLWCITRQDLFAPALARVGLAADCYDSAYRKSLPNGPWSVASVPRKT
jgi:hypothetical protein